MRKLKLIGKFTAPTIIWLLLLLCDNVIVLKQDAWTYSIVCLIRQQ